MSTLAPASERLTPMMRQYRDAKAENPDAILMFRMGDFFEMFFEDAVTAAKELDLTLTSRDKDRTEGGVPMAGVPHHAVTGYITKLVERGFTVAVCDQIEDPRHAKGLVRRAITRLVTPGTLSDLEALDPAAQSYVAYAAPDAGGFILSMLDLLAGEILVTRLAGHALADELNRMNVAELLVERGVRLELGLRLPIRELSEPAPSAAEASALLRERCGSSDIAGFDGDATPARKAVARLIAFAENTQRRPIRHLSAARCYRPSDALVLDEATRRNLELLRTQLDGEREGSLLWHLDRARTAMGSRLLRAWLLFPLRDAARIERRLDAVELLKRERPLREEVQAALAEVRDLERLIGRLALGRATPRDLAAMRASLGCLPALQKRLATAGSPLATRWATCDVLADLHALIARALVDEPPLTAQEGGVFRRGYLPELDALIDASSNGHDALADMERRERARTGIGNLKVRFNKVFGYYIEVTKANLDQVPADFARKQTLVGAERFITPELKTYEDRVLGADEERCARELMEFERLVEQVTAHVPRLRAASRLLAETDALAALGQVADEGRYVRPTLAAEPVVELTKSRHPVVERLMPGGERFVPNDLLLHADSRQLMLITGPNMAGKSTVMRQAALCTILAHMGSFVPAERAVIGLCDRVFTRVGAADALGRGRSTFMVEMIETATILNQATKYSLVLLDEIGRGTSTFDGLSIAWAVAEDLHDRVGCRTLFATHYHELTELAALRPRVVNASVAVAERDHRIVFLRQLVDGATLKSFGIEVARLAEVPEAVLKRAREVLARLEAGEVSSPTKPPPTQVREPSAVETALAALQPERLTPIEALVALDRLHKMLDKS